MLFKFSKIYVNIGLSILLLTFPAEPINSIAALGIIHSRNGY